MSVINSEAPSVSFACPQSTRSLLEEARAMQLAKISLNCEDDINRLIKKLAVSFSAKITEAQFSIEDGIFYGAHFHLTAEDQDLTVRISQIEKPLKRLLASHKELLKTRLAQHEINLRELRFS